MLTQIIYGIVFFGDRKFLLIFTGIIKGLSKIGINNSKYSSQLTKLRNKELKCFSVITVSSMKWHLYMTIWIILYLEFHEDEKLLMQISKYTQT